MFDTSDIKHVAIIGASEQRFYASTVMRCLRSSTTPLAIYPVHPTTDSFLGEQVWTSIDELPESPDLAVLLVRPQLCLEQLDMLNKRGCKKVIVVADGFAETGTPEGIAHQAALVEAATMYGTGLLGPNSVGFADVSAGLYSLAVPTPHGLSAGYLSIISQSGALLVGALATATAAGIGIDLAVSVGNGAVSDVIDAISTALDRVTTKTVFAYVESFGDDAARLEEMLAHAAAAGKRLIILHSGRSDIGRSITASHTGSLAVPRRFIDSLLARYGVVQIDSFEQLAPTVAVAAAFGTRPVGASFVVTSTGGGAAITGDLAEAHNLPLADLGQLTQRGIEGMLPDSGYAGNPLDMSSMSMDAEQAAQVYDAILADPAVGHLVFIAATGFPDDRPERQFHRDQLEVLAECANTHGKILIVAAMPLEPLSDWMRRKLLAHSGLVAVSGVESAVTAIAALHSAGTGDDSETRTRGRRRTSQSGPLQHSQPRLTVLTEKDGRAALEAVGVSVVPGCAVGVGEAPADVADKIGYPLVLKGIVPGLSHKMAAGAVELGLGNRESVQAAVDRMKTRLAEHPDELQLEGFLLERMVSGTELLVGLTRDPTYGPAVTIGLGSSLAEVTDHHATAILPLHPHSGLDRLIRDARLERLAQRLHEDVRERLYDSVSRLCDEFVAGGLDSYSTVEINPLFITPAGEILAGDALLVTGS
ncbi:acetate--CoA ligase family protein [Rhodococcus erythropolis]